MASSYTLFQIPVPPTHSDVIDYSNLRLLALKTDPSCFSSTYDREASFPQEEWVSRIDSSGKATFIAYSGNSKGRVGLVSILSPAVLRSLNFTPPEGVVEVGEALYVIVSMWVHPDHRGKRIGKALIKAAFDWMQKRDELDKGGKRVLGLEVDQNNQPAYHLYCTMGFKVVKNSGEDLNWMTAGVLEYGNTG